MGVSCLAPKTRGMRKVRIRKTGEIKEVTNNEAHGLIEAGIARLYYPDKEMRPTGFKKGYVTK